MMYAPSNSQRGFALTSVMIAILIATVLAAIAAGRYVTIVNDAAAESTGAYLMNVRGAVLKTLSEHMHAYTQVDISPAPAGTYPTAPVWASFSGDSQLITVTDLKDAGLLSDDFPSRPPLGRSAHIRFLRTGVCPGPTCNVEAFIYTCWPISSAPLSGAVDVNTCPAAPGGLQYDAGMVGSVVMATEGNGGSNSIDPARIHGTLFNVAVSDLGLPPNNPGLVAVLASLNNTMFNQFVRQGDTRHIYFNERLSVDGQIQSNTGFLARTAYAVGSGCDEEGRYATSDRNSLVMCKGGSWFELNTHVISSHSALANGQTAPAPFCPGGNLEPFYVASILESDVTMTGGDINVHGTQAGTISGSGTTNASGSVSVSGTFTGTFQSLSTSSIRVGQSASVNNSGVVTITPNGPNARALVISGCRTI